MQDLTFGEQVKIVLSRKNMTIKELAKKIEIRTKKKMSRQNLTQRLGRDNFQEQDMRMIAEILGCPFRLDILGDSLSAEKTEEPLKDEVKGRTEEPAETWSEQTEDQTEEIAEKGLEQAEDQTEEIAEKGLEQADGQTEEISEESLEQADDQTIEEPGGQQEKEAAVSNERDITIGELVDIHKELDEMIEKATGELPKLEGHLEEEHREEEPAGAYEPAGYDYPDQQIQTQQEAEPGNGISAEEREPIEKLLEEIESMENEDKKEEKQEEKSENQAEKPHGWRAYFMQRFKKKGKDQPAHNEEPHAENSTAEEERTRNGYMVSDSVEGAHAEDVHMDGGYSENTYAESGYAESGYAESGYTENMYEETSYRESGYTENIYEETGYGESGYTANTYPEDGGAGMYAEDSQSVEYAEDPYAETGYLQEKPQEEEEEKGERNPYTGKEYESNSVRMHPSRIGYVQVYDRSNHEWTDMTEWAFLGYQERKKQLLGKDYDPPIYLD